MRKLMIVIEENGAHGGKGFDLYLAGDVERLADDKIKDDDLSPAEFWGSRLFQIAVGAVQQAGAVKEVREKKDEGEMH